jgi:putative acetyltransferase
VIVRPERPEDRDAVHDVVAAAFDDPRVAPLVDALRASDGYLPELSLVADEDGEVIGHVMFTTAPLGSTRYVILSPLAVRPDRQRRGVGTALVEAGIAGVRRGEEPLLIVEGDPRYYSRFGFVDARALGLEPPNDRIPPGAFQAIALREEHPRGRVVYPPEFAEL